MDGDQLRRYFHLLDLPLQLLPDPLPSAPHPALLALLQSRHLMRLPYQSRDLHHHQSLPRPSLAVDDLLADMSVRGGHCYQHSELLLAALTSLGFTVARVACWVLNGKEYREGMLRTHNILVVAMGGEHFLMDVGYGRRSPRFPLRLTFRGTEEVEVCEGERYRVEVSPSSALLLEHLPSSDSWFPLYGFPLDPGTQLPRTVTLEETMSMFEELYTSTDTIVIRDVKMCINLQTVASRINFMSDVSRGAHTLRLVSKGRTEGGEEFDSQEEMLDRVTQMGVRALGH